MKASKQIYNIMEKEKLVTITRSYSRKISNPNNRYENSDYFCSKGEECYESEASQKSAEAHEFCKSEVESSINAYKEENKPAEKEITIEPIKENLDIPVIEEKPAYQKSNRGWESKTDHEETVGEEQRFNNKEREKYGN